MVVSLSNISPSQGSSYYTREGYLSQDEQRSHSQWTGKLARILGVSGHVDAQAFALLLQSKDLSGEVLIDKSRLHQQQSNARSQSRSVPTERAGIDLTSSAPKSISIQALVFGDSRLENAHRQATEVMLQVVESRYAITRITQDKKRLRITTGKLAIAQFHHDTSRALDPQLHTHNVLLNLQQRPDGKWQILDNTAIYRAKMLLGLIYRNELAVVVQQIGYEIEIANPKHGFWELKGYEQRLLKQFSKRAQHIREVASEEVSSQHKAWIASHSQRAKKKVIPREELVSRWQAEAEVTGICSIESCHSIQRSPDVAQSLVQESIAWCVERHVLFRQEDLERHVLTHIGQISFEELQRAISAASNLITVTDEKEQQQYTSQQVLDLAKPASLSENDEGELTHYELDRGLEASQTVRHHSTANSSEARSECDRDLSEAEGDDTANSDETISSDIESSISSSNDTSATGTAIAFSTVNQRMAGVDATRTCDSRTGRSTACNSQAPSPQFDYPQTDAGSGSEENRSHRYLLHQLADEFAELERVFSGESDERYQSTDNFTTPDRDQLETAAGARRADEEPNSGSPQYEFTIETSQDLEDGWSPSH
ncbi:MAG: MobF family relaxase [Leptolyngbyaceae cyanobacterium bins.302]|nr:MobF family relaxase [Leptolyngbyaceae cyanobacterium bins.302]